MPAPFSHIILFDGVCNLCNGAVNFLIDRDPKARFRFASLQSAVARDVLQETEIDPERLDSLVYIENGHVFTESAAALRISGHLPGLWPLLRIFLLVPRPIRDAVYRWIARNRYRWFGQRETCRLPTPEERARFLA